MSLDTCISSLKNALDLLSGAHPVNSSTLTPYLIISRPSVRYNHANSYKRLLKRFGDARMLLKRIVERIHDVEVDLEQEEKAVRNALSPVQALPVECMREIFLWLARDSLYCDAGLILGRVCSSWRTLSSSVPELWTHVRDPGTALRMIRTNRKLSRKLPLRLTMACNPNLAVDLWLAEEAAADVLEAVHSLRITIPNGRKSGEFVSELPPLPNLQEIIIIRTAGMESWEYFKLAQDVSAVTTKHPYSVSSVQVHGCCFNTKQFFRDSPNEIVLSDMSIIAASRTYDNIVRDLPNRLHLRRICRGDVDSLGEDVEDFLQSMEVWGGLPHSLVLDECPPELCSEVIVCVHAHDEPSLKELQILLPDLRLEPQSVREELRGSMVSLSSVDFPHPLSISIAAPFQWVFDILESTIKWRHHNESDLQLSPLTLRLTISQWAKSDTTEYPEALLIRWQAVNELISPPFDPTTIRLSLVMTDSLVRGFEDVARRFCEKLTLLPEGDECTVDYSQAKYPRDHYEFSK